MEDFVLPKIADLGAITELVMTGLCCMNWNRELASNLMLVPAVVSRDQVREKPNKRQQNEKDEAPSIGLWVGF